MDEKYSVRTLLQAKQSVLKSKLDVLLAHPVTKGDHCESVWIDFFRSILPSKYAVDKGFVFDCKGNFSNQIDIIIYDALYAPLLFETEAGEKYVTAESVYAVFESKSILTEKELVYANNKIESVRKLYRSRRDVINAGKKQDARPLTKIIGGVLSNEIRHTEEECMGKCKGNTIGAETLKKHLRKYENIDIGCAINHYTFLKKEDNNEIIVNENKQEIILTFFFVLLNELYKLGTVAAIDIREYAEVALVKDFHEFLAGQEHEDYEAKKEVVKEEGVQNDNVERTDAVTIV